MSNNQQKEIYEKTIFKLNKNLGIKNEDKNQIKSEKNSNINNTPTDLSSPEPSFMYQKNSNLINKNKFYHMLEVSFDKEYFRLFFYINQEDNLNIELIPKDGTLPFSYKNTFDKKKFFKMNKIFMELKTVEKIAEKIVNLFKKEKVLLGKNKKEDIFYLILKITIIDEDIDIFIPLKKNEDIQLCTISYLLKEADKLKIEFTIYKNEIEELIKNQNNEINELKKTNLLYLNIIKKIGCEYENKINKVKIDDIEEDENNKNYEIVINNEKKDKINCNDENKELKKIEEIIIDEDEEYKNIEKKIEILEKEIQKLDENYKCDINAKYKILNLSINQAKPYINIYFELSNIGLCPLTNKLDDIFCNLEEIDKNSINFYNEQERYIFLSEPLLPGQKIIISKKIIMNNPIPNKKYKFFLNIYSLNHGKISAEPIQFHIFIRENENQKNFLSFLNNTKFNLNNTDNNKKKKIILEYIKFPDEYDDNNFRPIKNGQNKINSEITIRQFIYDEKSGMALEDKNKNKILDENFNNNHINFKDKYLQVNIVINKHDLENIYKKIKKKYKKLNLFNKEKIEEIICSCLGDYNTICTFIEKMI